MSFSGGATPGTAALDTNGYPTQSFTGTVNVTFPNPFWTGVTYAFSWTSGTKLQITALGVNTGCSLSGIGGAIGGCGGGNVTLTIDGTGAGSMTWTPSTFALQFPGTASYGAAGTASLRLTRSSDAAIAGYITPEYKAALSGLHPKTVRTMGIDGTNSTNQANWNYRSKPTSVVFQGQWPLGAWSGGVGSAGTITGTNQYTAPAAPDTSLAGWVANEVIQGTISNPQSALISVSGLANNGSGLCRLTVSSTATLTTNQQVWVSDVEQSTSEINTNCSNAIFPVTVIDGVTIDLQGSTFGGTYKANSGAVGTQTLAITGKSGGAKFISGVSGFPTGYVDASMTAGLATFTYDAILDRAQYVAGSASSGVPIEVEASIANAVGANLWANIPNLADNNFVTNWAAAACSNLNSNLYFYPEYSNEIWNAGFKQTKWASNVGISFGFPVANLESVFGWYGLRVRQIMGNLIPVACSGRMSSVRRTLMFQAFGDTTGNKTFRFNGADLAPSGTSTGKGNAAYNSYSGSANYTASPNRPIDVVESIGYAPYVSGTNFSDQGSNGGTVATSANAAFLQTLATAFDANPNDPTSLAALDNDQRQGTQSSLTQAFICPSGTTVTLTSHGFTNTASSSLPALFTASAGTVCNGISLNTAYCFINVATNTFQVAAYNSDGTCGSTPIALTPGSGTSSVGPMNSTTILSMTATRYAAWETIAASYDGSRSAGMASLRMELYEGAIQPVTPSIATLTSIGVLVGGSAATANADLQAGLLAWKNNALSAATQTYYFSGFETGYPHSKTPSHLVLPCGGQYGLLSTCFPNSTPYQLYNGFAAFNGVP